MENPKVSLFERYNKKIPVQQVYLFDWVCSSKYKDWAKFIRSLPSKSEQREHKAKLPCITPSGIFSYCKDDSLDLHSGYICIDIDGGEDNPDIVDFEMLKQDLSNIEYIAYCGLSISGKGVFCLVQIAYPQHHKEHFYALEKFFLDKGIVIDSSCKNISRLRGASYDSNPILNMNAITFTDMIERSSKVVKEYVNSGLEHVLAIKTPQNIPMIMSPILQRIGDNKIDITGNRTRWFSIGCALAREYGEEGRCIFHAVSQFYKNEQYHYMWEEAEIMYDSCLKDYYKYRYTIATFYYWCKDYGIL